MARCCSPCDEVQSRGGGYAIHDCLVSHSQVSSKHSNDDSNDFKYDAKSHTLTHLPKATNVVASSATATLTSAINNGATVVSSVASTVASSQNGANNITVLDNSANISILLPASVEGADAQPVFILTGDNQVLLQVSR